MQVLHLDIETYSSAPLPKCGVYRYCDSPDFEILILSYAFNDDPVVTIDMACGEKLPGEFLQELEDPNILKIAHNASYERVCFSKHFGHWLDPNQWRCTMVMAWYSTMPGRLADVAAALKLTEQKMEEGKELIRYFSMPSKATRTNGGRTRNLPEHAPEKWATYKKYNAQDVETERAVYKVLLNHPLPDHEWELYALDQTINDRGVRIDKALVKSAIAVDSEFSARAYQKAQQITGLDNPGSVAQLKAWLADQDVPMESLAKKLVREKAAETDGIVSELLNLRLELSKTSVKKYEAMARSVCRDGRVRGTLQFYGANRTGRWSGRLVQLQNVPQNHLPDLDLAREIVKQGDTETVEMLFGSVPNTLSELIRTAFIPKEGCRFIVADFSAIEARVLAWLAGEEWVLEEFRGAGKIYEETASRMYHIPKESIVKGNPNYEYRQKGKQATLSCGYAGGVGALKAMGAKMPEEEMQPLVDAWRAANPHIVAFWGAMERAARSVIRRQNSARVGKVRLFWKDDKLFMRLPSGRDLCYQSPHFTENRFGNDAIGYYAPSAAGKMVEQETFGGKIVENCLAEGTLILTNHGLVPIEHIAASHLIWDGEAFVTHEGLLSKGKQMTICVDGVWMTPDHKILTEKGMVACGQSEGLNWAPVQLPDGFEERREQQTRQTDVEVQMRLWKRDCDSGMLSRPQRQKVSSAFMRLYEKSAAQQSTHNAWDESSPGICSVAFYEPTVRRSQPSSISQLRWAWNQSVRRMAAQFRSLLERYGADVQEGFGTGSDGQRWGLLRGKLSLGGTKNQCPEPQSNENNQHTLWQNVRGGIVRTNGYRGNNDTVSIGSQVADRISVYKTQSSKSVYDIRNCGPRHRFTVWANGRARVVSNCTQAIARDLLAYAMQNLEHHGYHIVIHIHDEAVMEVPLDFGSVEEACTIMGQGPAWAEGLPLRADGYECSSYRKM